MNMTVPASMVTNDQVYKMRKKGCNNMSRPRVINTQAAISIGPRRSCLGQLLRVGAAWGDMGGEAWGVDIECEGLFTHSTEGNAAQ
jgi:hypothetical protein